MSKWFYRWAPSLGELEDTPENIWGISSYDASKHLYENVVFCGMYGFPDFYSLWQHKGKKVVWWAGDDIRHFKGGYWLDEDGQIRMIPKPLAEWINTYCDNYIENEIERDLLADIGIDARIVQSFLGEISKFPISYKHARVPNVFVSGHPGREEEYGFEYVEKIAKKVPGCIFHLYGAKWKSKLKNIVCHGIVSKDQFNKEIKKYQCGWRPNKRDGFSEILAKSVLMGQHPISRIPYPNINSYNTETILLFYLHLLSFRYCSNTFSADYYRETLNNYPWVKL